MSNGWDFSTSSNNNTTYIKTEYTKFPVGITRIRIVDDAPHMRWAHWWKQASRYVTCPGKNCPICEIRRRQKAESEPITINMTRRYSINIINKETGKLEVLEQGIGFFEEIKEMKDALAAKGLNLIDSDIAVKRRGTGQEDTSYRHDLGEATPLTKNEEKLLEKRYNFEEFYKPHEPALIQRLLNGEKWEDLFYKNNNENTGDSSEEDEEIVIK